MAVYDNTPFANFVAQASLAAKTAYQNALTRINQQRQSTLRGAGYAADINPESGVVGNLHVARVVAVECRFELERHCELTEDGTLFGDTDKRKTYIALEVCFHTFAKPSIDVWKYLATKGLCP